MEVSYEHSTEIQGSLKSWEFLYDLGTCQTSEKQQQEKQL
jgi:hypothetical protein